MILDLNKYKEFLKEETIDGYYITKKQKKIWLIQLDLCKKLVEVCKKHDIKVFLFAGSLLGAVRHEGFIPWDDDMDVALLRDDYEKLKKVAKKEFEAPYFFQTADTDKDFFIGYARLRNSETTGFITYNNTETYNNGIYIDVYVLDGYIDDKTLLKKQIKKIKKLEKILNFYYSSFNHSCYGKMDNLRFCLFKIKQNIVKIVPYKTYLSLYDKTLMKYNNNSVKVARMTHTKDSKLKKGCDKKFFDSIVFSKFEKELFPIPEKYDELLRNSYGEYMKFPPIEKRGKWHYHVLIQEPDISYKEYYKENKDFILNEKKLIDWKNQE